MALNTIFKARKAMKLHNEGNCDEALKLYEECMNEGLKDMKTILPYSVRYCAAASTEGPGTVGIRPEIPHGG